MPTWDRNFTGGSYPNNWHARLDYWVDGQDIPSNSSLIRLRMYVWCDPGYSQTGLWVPRGRGSWMGEYGSNVNRTINNSSGFVLMASWDGWVGHNADGTKYVTVGTYCNAPINDMAWADIGWTLPTIPRYANITSLTSSSTDVAITANVSVDATCDLISLSIDNGASYPYVLGGDFTSKSITTTGAQLQSNKTYNCYIAVKRKDSQLTSYSSPFNVTTAEQSNFMALL